MTAAPGRTSAQRVDALLVIDMEKTSAHYECYRPGCPKPREEPIKPSATRAFIDGITTRHLAQHHGETR
jgi:hypothetical protein